MWIDTLHFLWVAIGHWNKNNTILCVFLSGKVNGENNSEATYTQNHIAYMKGNYIASTYYCSWKQFIWINIQCTIISLWTVNSLTDKYDDACRMDDENGSDKIMLVWKKLLWFSNHQILFTIWLLFGLFVERRRPIISSRRLLRDLVSQIALKEKKWEERNHYNLNFKSRLHT